MLRCCELTRCAISDQTHCNKSHLLFILSASVHRAYISLVFPPRRPMGADCCDRCDVADPHRGNVAYRRVLSVVLAINALMFAVEIGAGLVAGSAALQADALDFLGDAANYAISLSV